MHARFRAGEKLEITSNAYLSLSIRPTYMAKSCDCVVTLLKKLKPYASFICYTSNENLGIVKAYLEANDIPCDKINENVDFVKKRYNSSGKVYYNIFLDDKAGLGQAYRILNKFYEYLLSLEDK